MIETRPGTSRKYLFAVVHVKDLGQTARNIETAYENGTDGVFLIGHSMKHADLIDVCAYTLQTFRYQDDFNIGVNFLDLDPFSSLYAAHALCADGIWLDNVMGKYGIPLVCEKLQEVQFSLRKIPGNKCPVPIFGGVDFKYQQPSDDYADDAKKASGHIDVVTTSGAETGRPPSEQKIQRMKNYLGSKNLAIASGITPENVAVFLPYTTYFLVATGISKDEHNLDPNRVKELAEAIHAYNA